MAMEEKPELGTNPGFFKDLVRFMLGNSKWWLIPVVIVLGLLGCLLILGGTAVAPFIYTLF